MGDAHVAMLDHKDWTAHRPATGQGNFVAVCGAVLGDEAVTVGPAMSLLRRARRRCQKCWTITCPKCKRVSHHPVDVLDRYCGACHVYHEQLLAFRVYVAGELVDERWSDPEGDL
jgi:hypothetical protein